MRSELQLEYIRIFQSTILHRTKSELGIKQNIRLLIYSKLYNNVGYLPSVGYKASKNKSVTIKYFTQSLKVVSISLPGAKKIYRNLMIKLVSGILRAI